MDMSRREKGAAFCFAARLRIFERLVADTWHGRERHEHGSLVSDIIAGSREVHNKLALKVIHRHSLSAAFLQSLAFGRLSHVTAAKICWLGHVADALRHVTPVSIRLLVEELDVEMQAHGGIVMAQRLCLRSTGLAGHDCSGLMAVMAPPARQDAAMVPTAYFDIACPGERDNVAQTEVPMATHLMYEVGTRLGARVQDAEVRDRPGERCRERGRLRT